MAIANVTGTPVIQGSTHALASMLNLPELEKISCSFRGESCIHPLALMGKQIRNARLLYSAYADVPDFPFQPQSLISVSRVLAVNLGSIEHGIESSFLLQDDDGSDAYYSDFSELTILEVLPDPAPAI